MKPGDRVLIETKEQSLEGTLIPRPEMLEKGIIVLKLDNGYNIGIEEKKIKNSKVLEAYKPKKESKKEVKEDPKLPTVAILSFGGTISSKIDYSTGGVKADYTAEDFLEMLPELRKVANIRSEKAMQIMSEDVDFKALGEITKTLAKYLEDKTVKGIVMTVGTDALHFISAALRFTLQNLSKPIIITASQRSIDRGSSDAFMNLACSVKAAANWDGAEIVTCMHASSNDDSCILINGSKVRKMHTSRRDAFRPINDLPYAEIDSKTLEINILNENYVKRDERILEISPKISDKVGLLYVHPNIDSGLVDYYVSKGYKGLVIAGTALGHVPTEGAGNLLPAIEKAVKAGMVVAIATQTLYGRTHPYVYTNLRKLSVKAGCIFAEDMTPETAYVKLAWLIANEKNVDYVKEKFPQNSVGEITESIGEETFLY